MRGSCAGVLLSVLCLARPCCAVTAQGMIDWGLEAYAETVASLQKLQGGLFAETASLAGNQYGGSGGFAYVWPLSTQFRVQNSLARIDPATYVPVLRQFSDELRARYWSASGGGYRSGVSASATRFYDDNAHIAVALMEAHRITADPIYLTRAEETYDFVLSGEDGAGGGGIYFHEFDRSVKETISTLQAARAGLMLHQATGDEAYLADATRLYDWTRTHTQQADGLFLEKYYLSGPNAGTAGDFTLVNAAGDAISTNLEFYASTGDLAPLREAQRIAGRSLTRYFNSSTGAINDEGFWAFELVDALDDLAAVDGNPLWRSRNVRAMEWLHANRRDPNGHYGRLWGRGGFQVTPLAEWHLNDQAAVARSYLHTGLAMQAAPLAAGDYNEDGMVDAADYVVWRTTGGTQQGYETWQANFGRTVGGSGTSVGGSALQVAVPEPRAVSILLWLAAYGTLCRHRARRCEQGR